MQNKLQIIVLLGLLAACADQRSIAPSTASVNPPSTDACGAAKYQHLVGQSIRKTLELSFVNETRYFGRSAPIARDPLSSRLNIVTSDDLPLPEASNIITDEFCG